MLAWWGVGWGGGGEGGKWGGEGSGVRGVSIYIYIYLCCSFSGQSQKAQTALKAGAAMAPASSVQSSEKLGKWQFEGSEDVEEQGSEGHSSQSPEEEVEVEDKTEELMWRILAEVS